MFMYVSAHVISICIDPENKLMLKYELALFPCETQSTCGAFSWSPRSILDKTVILPNEKGPCCSGVILFS